MHARFRTEYLETLPEVFAAGETDTRRVGTSEGRRTWAIVAGLVLAVGGLAWFAAALWLGP